MLRLAIQPSARPHAALQIRTRPSSELQDLVIALQSGLLFDAVAEWSAACGSPLLPTFYSDPCANTAEWPSTGASRIDFILANAAAWASTKDARRLPELWERHTPLTIVLDLPALDTHGFALSLPPH